MDGYNWQIQDNYEIRSMARGEFEPLHQKYTKKILDDETQTFRFRESLSDDERAKLKKLTANMGELFELRLGVFHKSEFVGWHFGRQDSYTSFYMQSSGILGPHRRNGLYSELVKRVLQITTDLGFQDVWSRHNATNNAVIIPKLKQGFLITALEVTDLFGTLAHLHYYPKEVRRKMMDYRVGQIKPDAEIKKYLGL